MHNVNEIIAYILGFKSYVLLPMILLGFALVFRMRPATAVKASLTIGIGFIGIFMVLDYFVARIGPAVQALVARTGLRFNVLDVGWPPMAAITWSYRLAVAMLILIMAVNLVMLILRWTKTVNIDIWNYWHPIFLGALVYELSGNLVWSIAATTAATVFIIKLADWSVPALVRFTGLEGISITTFSGIAYFPWAVLGDRLIERIPGLNRLDVNPETLKRRLGLFGEPMMIGVLMGLALGIAAGYEVKMVLELAFEIAAVIFILPMMSGVLGQGLTLISDGMKDFIKKYLPGFGEAYIGLDLAILVGNTSAIVTGILLMPVAIILAVILPGVKFIPLGDLGNMIGAMVIIVMAARGNVIRAVLLGIPVIIGKLYIASWMAPVYTRLAQKANLQFQGYHGLITSFLDGGNIIRFWMVKLFIGSWWAWCLIPLAAGLLYYTAWVAGKSRQDQ